MKTLMLMRHSHAVSNNSAYSDDERPLSDDGRQLAERTAELINKDWSVDRVVSSSAVRTKETAAIICNDADAWTSDDDLYLASPDAYSIAASTFESDVHTGLLIGHNPGIASLMYSWSNESFSVSPATVAVFEIEIDDWKRLLSDQPVSRRLVAYISNGQRIR